MLTRKPGTNAGSSIKNLNGIIGRDEAFPSVPAAMVWVLAFPRDAYAKG
jgi:hypothetical protein